MLLPGRNTNSPKGFVLVLVLVLLSLVTILVVVSAIMARVERRASWNSARVEQARQNALFALNVAAGQLQREAGPDQRVTARADILSSGTTIYQPTWTGVWKTFNPTAGPQPLDSGTTTSTPSSSAIRPWSTNPNLVGGNTSNYVVDAANPNMAWLVSGGTNNAMINPTVSSTAAWISNSVILARNLAVTGSTGAVTGTSSVYVPLVPVVSSSPNKSGTLGKYGYWVSDEGIKAKATILDPTLTSSGTLSYVQNQSHFLTSQANMMGNTLPVISGSDTRTDFAVTKISTIQSLSLLPSLTGSVLSGTGAGAYSPDVTTYSRGVLSDVRNGGLKRDLTAAFETDAAVNPSNQFQELLACGGGGQNGEAVYRAANSNVAVPVLNATGLSVLTNGSSTITQTIIDGLRWESLYLFYNMFKTAKPMWRTYAGGATDPSGIRTSTLGLTSTSYWNSTFFSSYSDGGGASFNMDPIAPRVLEARVDIALCSFCRSDEQSLQVGPSLLSIPRLIQSIRGENLGQPKHQLQLLHEFNKLAVHHHRQRNPDSSLHDPGRRHRHRCRERYYD